MHFWIDKRSQCQYTGRHRVPSTLSSGAGGCNGRVCRKAPAPIHRVSTTSDNCPPSRRPRSRRRHHTSPNVPSVQSRRNDDSSLYVEIPVEPPQPQPQPTIASLAAARSVTPDTLLRTAALGLNDSAMFAPHLKFGMLVSLAIGAIFVAGAKYYFEKSVVMERRGYGGVGALCAWVGGAAAAACCLAVCRRPPAPPPDPPCRVSSTALRRSPTRSVAVEPPTPASVEFPEEAGEAPPPYHIAVLLPSPARSPVAPPPAYNALPPGS